MNVIDAMQDPYFAAGVFAIIVVVGVAVFALLLRGGS